MELWRRFNGILLVSFGFVCLLAWQLIHGLLAAFAAGGMETAEESFDGLFWISPCFELGKVKLFRVSFKIDSSLLISRLSDPHGTSPRSRQPSGREWSELVF